MRAYYEARAGEYDDWYLRRGRYARGPVHDTAWHAEVDAAGRWLDGLPMAGRIVELAAGTGWWSPLLAAKGELSMFDAAPAPLVRAGVRRDAPRRRAHLHVRAAWAEPEPPAADALFAGFWLSHVERDRTAAFLELASRWLAPGGRIALIDSLPDPRSGAVDHPAPAADRSVRPLAHPRPVEITKVFRTPDQIAAAPAPASRPAAAAATPPTSTVARSDGDLIAYYEARAPEYDDWYLRRGRYEHGPIHDAAWNAELDAAGGWLDGLSLSGRIVELAAGTGWWSPLLAARGELWLSDAAEAPLERARERLVAHRLRAHLHVRDAWAEPIEPPAPADALFAGFWLSHVERDRTAAFLELAARWLAPGGRLALIDSLPDPRSGATDHRPAAGDRAVRRLADGRSFTIVKVFRTADEIAAAMRAAGFVDVEVTTTGRFFVLATGRRG
jgi:SAM-dependent methyltransferase